jgi:predicted secreted protein
MFFLPFGFLFWLLINLILLTMDVNMQLTEYSFPMPEYGTSLFVKYKAGSTFTISIKGNISTGYAWYLLNLKQINESQIKPLNINEDGSTKEYIQENNSANIYGAGGVFNFKFLALNPSRTTLNFVLKRPWEDNAEKSKSLMVIID